MQEASRWVFGYGSLMWDSWEVPFSGQKFTPAILGGFRRSFNKASVRNWGTPEVPGPTLGLEVDPIATCIGVAFEFHNSVWKSVVDQLRSREGLSFELKVLPVTLSSGKRVDALVPVNLATRPTYIGRETLEKRAQLIMAAVGKDGRCVDYFMNVVSGLKALQIEDAEVINLLTHIENKS